jgi:hypothetical protein
MTLVLLQCIHALQGPRPADCHSRAVLAAERSDVLASRASGVCATTREDECRRREGAQLRIGASTTGRSQECRDHMYGSEARYTTP